MDNTTQWEMYYKRRRTGSDSLSLSNWGSRKGTRTDVTENVWDLTMNSGLSTFYTQWRQTRRITFFPAAAKSLQSCPTLCDPRDSSTPGSPVPGILQARTLEWVAISFSNAWKWKVKVKALSHVRLLATPWIAAHQATEDKKQMHRLLCNMILVSILLRFFATLSGRLTARLNYFQKITKNF